MHARFYYKYLALLESNAIIVSIVVHFNYITCYCIAGDYTSRAFRNGDRQLMFDHGYGIE